MGVKRWVQIARAATLMEPHGASLVNEYSEGPSVAGLKLPVAGSPVLGRPVALCHEVEIMDVFLSHGRWPGLGRSGERRVTAPETVPLNPLL